MKNLLLKNKLNKGENNFQDCSKCQEEESLRFNDDTGLLFFISENLQEEENINIFQFCASTIFLKKSGPDRRVFP